MALSDHGIAVRGDWFADTWTNGWRYEPCTPPPQPRVARPGQVPVVFERHARTCDEAERLLAIGYSAGVQARQRMGSILLSIARMYLWRFLPGGKRARFYSINIMRAHHPAWFREDLERLFELLATHVIQPRVAERISFDEVPDEHRRLDTGGLFGKIVLCPDSTLRSDRGSPRRESTSASA